MKTLKTLLLTFISISFLCCLSSCVDNEEEVRLHSDLSNEELVDMVAINFLSEYGGIETERIAICPYVIEHMESCDLDSMINFQILDSISNYVITIDGDFKVECHNSGENPYDRIIRYRDDQSLGESEVNAIALNYDMKSSLTYLRKLETGNYASQGSSVRNLDFTSEGYTNFDGTIRFRSDIFEFDFDDCTFSNDAFYTFTLSLINRTGGDQDRLDFEGDIKLQDEVWTLTSESGLVAVLE